MSRYRMLAIDIDGTLVDLRDEISPATAAALDRAVEAGIQVVLATGRRYDRAYPIVARLRQKHPIITASGALIKHPADHRTLFKAQLPRETLEGVLAVVGLAGYDAVLYGDTFAEGIWLLLFPRRCRTGRSCARVYRLNVGFANASGPMLMTDPPAGSFGGFAMGELP